MLPNREEAAKGASSYRVKILEKNLEKALPILEELLGVKPFMEEVKADIAKSKKQLNNKLIN